MPGLSFTVHGQGKPVVLLHGFPFNRSLWDSFALPLGESFRVYCPDLPGFGESPLLHHPFTIDDIAGKVLEWTREQGILSPVIVGHSLGGYVALAMAALAPEELGGLVLFHSTALADSAEKKESRNKVLEFISNNGVKAFTSNFIGPLFASPNHPSIEQVRSIALHASEESVSGYTVAMRDRPDRTDALKTLNRPVLLIAGRHDAGIPVTSLDSQAAASPSIRLSVLEHSAHMGMLEEPEMALTVLRNFLSTL